MLNLLTVWTCVLVSASAFPVPAAIAHVSGVSGAHPGILLALTHRESSGNPMAVRYCSKWETRTHCIEEKSCYTNCTRSKVWKNRLDVGLFQLRDAPSWSWRRWYNKTRPPEEQLPPKCLVSPNCAKYIMAEVVRYLKGRARREKWKCKTGKINQIAWIAYWNGCGSYRAYARKWRRWAK